MNRARPRGITLANCQKIRARQGTYKTGAAAITTAFTTTPKKEAASPCRTRGTAVAGGT